MPLPFLNSIADDKLFPLTNVVLPAYGALVFLPRWKHTSTVVVATIVAYSFLYTLLMANSMIKGGGLNFSDMSTLQGVRRLLAHPDVTFGAWIHYIAYGEGSCLVTISVCRIACQI
jgi:hypothetical protein